MHKVFFFFFFLDEKSTRRHRTLPKSFFTVLISSFTQAFSGKLYETENRKWNPFGLDNSEVNDDIAGELKIYVDTDLRIL